MHERAGGGEVVRPAGGIEAQLRVPRQRRETGRGAVLVHRADHVTGEPAPRAARAVRTPPRQTPGRARRQEPRIGPAPGAGGGSRRPSSFGGEAGGRGCRSGQWSNGPSGDRDDGTSASGPASVNPGSTQVPTFPGIRGSSWAFGAPTTGRGEDTDGGGGPRGPRGRDRDGPGLAIRTSSAPGRRSRVAAARTAGRRAADPTRRAPFAPGAGRVGGRGRPGHRPAEVMDTPVADTVVDTHVDRDGTRAVPTELDGPPPSPSEQPRPSRPRRCGPRIPAPASPSMAFDGPPVDSRRGFGAANGVGAAFDRADPAPARIPVLDLDRLRSWLTLGDVNLGRLAVVSVELDNLGLRPGAPRLRRRCPSARGDHATAPHRHPAP